MMPIVRLTTPDEMVAVENAEAEVWGMPPLEVTPAHLLLVASKNGGLVLGAWAGETLAAFLFSFLGQEADGRFKHCSHVMGVLPPFRGQRLAQALKWRQREIVREQGLDLITWTFDPLESPNAALNLVRLGAICRRYRPNYYGVMADSLNAGLPTDRFEAEWWLNSSRVARFAAGELAAPLDRWPPVVNPPEHPATAERWPQPGTWALPDAPEVSVVIPTPFQRLRRDDPALALAWRLHARELFQTLFAAGYVAHHFAFEPGTLQGRYLLRAPFTL